MNMVRYVLTGLLGLLIGTVVALVFAGALIWLLSETLVGKAVDGVSPSERRGLLIWLFNIWLIPTLAGAVAASLAAPKRHTLRQGLLFVSLWLALFAYPIARASSPLGPGAIACLFVAAAVVSIAGVWLARRFCSRCELRL